MNATSVSYRWDFLTNDPRENDLILADIENNMKTF